MPVRTWASKVNTSPPRKMLNGNKKQYLVFERNCPCIVDVRALETYIADTDERVILPPINNILVTPLHEPASSCNNHTQGP